MVTATSNNDPHPRCTLTPDEGQFGGDRCQRLSGRCVACPAVGDRRNDAQVSARDRPRAGGPSVIELEGEYVGNDRSTPGRSPGSGCRTPSISCLDEDAE